MEKRIISRPHPDDATPAPEGHDCASCKAYCKLTTGGECRKHKPEGVMLMGPNGPQGAIGFWPATRPEQWCLEWQPKSLAFS